MAGTSYVFNGSRAARHVFNRRTAAADFAFLLPHLRPGLRVLDLGCGNGSITVDVAALVAPGAVRGVDVSDDAIVRARGLANERSVGNVEFAVGDVSQIDVEPQAYDVVIISCVLGHLPEPAALLVLAYRALVPGGILAIRDMNKRGDWFGGPHAESVARVNAFVAEDIRAMGGNPFVAARLPELLEASGFAEIWTEPSFSPTLSPMVNAGPLFGRVREAAFVTRVVARGSATEAELQQLADEIAVWADSPHSVAAMSECTALAHKPRG